MGKAGEARVTSSTRRDYRLDNLRCILIFLVVFSHLLVETKTRGPATRVLYQVINLFHMPGFVLLTGYFARFRPKRMFTGLVVPYVVFQVLASVRKNIVAGRVWSAGLTLLYPQWTLWYLTACVMWYCTVPLLERVVSGRAQLAVVVGSLVVSIAAGLAPWLGEFLDLARVVVFYPFFCGGYYMGRRGFSRKIDALDQRRLRTVQVGSTVVLVVAMTLHYAHGACPVWVLRRDTPYANGWECEARIIMQLAAVAWCLWLLVIVTNAKRGIASEVGRNTLSVYLLHTWVIRALRHTLPLPGGELMGIMLCAAIAAGTLVALGNDRVARAFRYVFACGWLKQS